MMRRHDIWLSLFCPFPHFNKNVNNVYSLSLKAKNSWHNSIMIYIDGWQGTACHIRLFNWKLKKNKKQQHTENNPHCDRMQLLQDWYLAFRHHDRNSPNDSRWLFWLSHLCRRHPSNSWALSPRLEAYSKLNIRLHSDAKGCQSKGLAANNNLSWDFRAPAGTQMCSGTFLQGGWWSAPWGTAYSCDSGCSTCAWSTHPSPFPVGFIYRCAKKSQSGPLAHVPELYGYNFHVGG